MLAALRRARKRGVAWNAVGVILAILVACALALVAWIIRSPLPKVNGTLALGGISEPVTIRRDDRGIPHIDASTESDLFFAQGFACAQDRLWQMDALRRQAQGRLSEIAGPGALETDRYMRTLGFRDAAQSDFEHLEGAARADLVAYAAGVNAAMNSHPLPLEFRLLRYAPDPWTPVDSISIMKLMAQRLDDQWSRVETLADLEVRVGRSAAAALTDNQLPPLEHYVAGQPAAGVGWARFRSPLPRALGVGSNNWVVSSAHTTTGGPVLANDTHLAHSLPSTWWLSHLHGGGYNVEGFQVPGLPGVILGHNEHIAFGVTAANEPVQDLFVERFRTAQSDEYLAMGHWLHAVHRIERIAIKGQQASVLDVLVTRHGPVIERRATRGLSLAWTILREGGEMLALTQVDTASNWQQFRNALRNVAGPVLNFVYADAEGNIGYQDVGRVPKRRNGDGTLPVEGYDDRFAWLGDMPFDDLPHAFNPSNGIIATANNALTRSKLAAFADAPYRVNRIYERLLHPGRKTPQQVGALQADVYDYPRARLAALTVAALQQTQNPLLQKIALQLASWNGMANTNSPIPTFLSAEDEILVGQLLRPKIGAALFERYRNDYHPITPLLRVFDGDKRLASIAITRATVLAALPDAALRAADSVGADAQHGLGNVERWGKRNAAIYTHPLGRFWPLNAMLNVRPLVQPGNTFTIYAGRPTYGPSQRLVVDLANWDNSSMLLTLGESGHATDPHYADQAKDFVNVRWVPTPFTDAAVARATKDTLVLKPK